MTSPLYAVELFSGAGGLSIGLERVGFQVILANELDTDSAKTFQMNHPQTTVLNTDIHEVNFQQAVAALGCHHITLVSGGPPCQGFSTVGSKKQQDPRNSLLYEYLRSVAEINPDYILFENVSGFKKLYHGNAYSTLLRKLEELGYSTTAGILEAADYGLPQKRQRTIVVGWKHHLPSVRFPDPTHGEQDSLFGYIPKLTLLDAISDLPEIQSGESKTQYRCMPQNDYQKTLREGCVVLTEHNVSNYGDKMKEILRLIPAGGTVEDLPPELRPKAYFKNTYARLLPDCPAPTITRNFGTPSSSRCVHPFQNRALSTREGARLQGFPDSYQFYGSKMSKNLQIGNAVPPIFGEIIATEIVNSIRAQTDTSSDQTVPCAI